MCGIIGYKGPRNANTIVLNGLKKLEYRGYDSWGLAANCGDITVVKNTGKVGEVDNFNIGESHAAIGHTRWATHGGVTRGNAHPHLSCDKKIALVHNGIIENYQELRRFLESRGHSFASETDTEVIVHLVEEYMNGTGFVGAVRKTLKQLKGSYAIVVIHKDYDEIIGAKKDSPLVVGIGDKEYFLSSDVPAFIDYTKDVVFLDDNEMVVVNKIPHYYNSLTGEEIEKEIKKIEWDAEQATKGDFEHFMIKEISEQNETILKAISRDDKRIMEVAKMVNDAFGVFFVGCGTSNYAALTASYVFSKITKKHINVVSGSEFPYYEHFLTDKTLVIAISQSGETADVIQAIKTAKKKGAKVLSIVNVMGSTVMRLADDSMLMNVGPEICVVSTKAYTAELAILTLLAYACTGKLGEGKEMLRKAAEETKQLTSAETRVKLVELASKLKDKRDIFLIGRGTNYPSAMEGALKIKEVSYIHAEAFPGGELKHGPIALIEKGVPCIVLVSNDEAKNETLNNAMEVKSRGGYIIGVAPENNEIFDYHLKVPDLGEGSAITNIIPIQILAYYLALLRECDVDKPRNLAKSVTVK